MRIKKFSEFLKESATKSYDYYQDSLVKQHSIPVNVDNSYLHGVTNILLNKTDDDRLNGRNSFLNNMIDGVNKTDSLKIPNAFLAKSDNAKKMVQKMYDISDIESSITERNIGTFYEKLKHYTKINETNQIPFEFILQEIDKIKDVEIAKNINKIFSK
jgi:hypothetical protein